MRITFGRILCAAAALGAAVASAAEFKDSFDLMANGATIIGRGTWTGSGTATNRTATYTVPGLTGPFSNYVVFEGMITNSFSARVTPDSTSNVVFQLVSKLAWWSELPDASYTSSKQGGICVTNNGILLAYTSDGWTRLVDTNTVGAIASVSSNIWNKLDFTMSYRGGTNALSNRVFYQVRVSNHVFRAVNTSQRFSHASPFAQNNNGTFLLSPATFTSGTRGIDGVVIGGAGSVDDLAVVPGGTGTPLSSAIDIRAYRSAEGVWVEFAAVDEEAGGGFVIVIRQNGVEIARRTVAQQGPNAYNVYRELFSELQAGQSYDFIVYDETGRPYYLDGVKVGEFAVSLVRMVASEMTIEWDSIAGRTYQVLQAEDGQLGGQFVPVPGMASVVATGAKSSAVIRLDPIKRSGFFRIIEK